MDTTEVPAVIRAAASKQHPTTPPEQRATRRGDLAIVGHAAVTRIICVTEVTDTHLVAVLCSNETEMATDHDVIIGRYGTYDLLLETDCRLVVLQTQIRGIVGTVDLDTINSMLSTSHNDGGHETPPDEQHDSTNNHAGPEYSTGLPLAGVNDPRWTFKKREQEDIVVLRDPAHQVLFKDGWNPGSTRHTTPKNAYTSTLRRNR